MASKGGKKEKRTRENRSDVALANLQKRVGGFLLYKFWGIFAWIFPEEDFSGHFFPTKMRRKKSGEKIREKIRRPKNKNLRKIRSAKTRPIQIGTRFMGFSAQLPAKKGPPKNFTPYS